MKLAFATAALAFAASAAFAAGHGMAPMIDAMNQPLANGTVMAGKVIASANGWLVVHRTDAEMKPGAVIGYAPLIEGENTDVAATLTEPVAPGEALILMLHSEDGGMVAGSFEFTPGSKEDVPVRIDGKPVMAMIVAE